MDKAVMKIKGGYYIKARQIRDSEIAHMSPHIREIFDWLVKEANHQDNKSSGIIIKRGQCMRSYKDIMNGLYWMVGWRKETYNKDQCEAAMKTLKKRQMVTTTKTTRGMIITICNYDYFQNPDNYDNRTDNHTSSTTITTDSPHYKQECKRIKNVRIKNTTTDKVQNFLFPDWLDKNLWNNYVTMRNKIRKPLTDKAIELAIEKLTALKDQGHNPSIVIKQSIFNSWQGLFPVKTDPDKFDNFKKWLDKTEI